MRRSPTLSLRARGGFAVFTDPAFKVERVSAPVMTPSAARGLLEAVLWKPAIRWHVERIKVLSPIRFISFRRNEANTKMPAPAASLVAHGGPAPVYVADDPDRRSQRNTVALRDVDYVVEAHFSLTERAGPDDTVPKFVDMFRRRVEKGQHFHQPYLGCREFPADVLAADEAPQPIAEDRDLGMLLWDIEYRPDGNRPIFFAARLEKGVLNVPADPEATLPTGGAQ